jgi:hypothetical protein
MAKTESPAEIMTVKALAEQYPQQVRQIAQDVRDALIKEITEKTPQQLQADFPDLVKKLGVPVISGINPESGFLLDRDDPYAAGAARDYAKARKCQVQSLPGILPWGDPATTFAMKMYLLRARCGGDTKRAAAAVEAVTKHAGKQAAEILSKK